MAGIKERLDLIIDSTVIESMKNKNIFSLYARPFFFEGIARLFDFTNRLISYNYSTSGQHTDYQAMLSDWEYIGNDIYDSIQTFYHKRIEDGREG